MEYLISLLISSILVGCLKYIDGLLENLFYIVLRPENYMSTLINTDGFRLVFELFLNFGLSLIVLKFIKKGFEQYILWTEGDADSDPVILLTGFFKAIAVAVCFPTLYDWLITIMEDLTNQTLTAIGVGMETKFAAIINGIMSAGLFTGIITLIFFICYFLLYVQFLTRGMEILILRIGLPLACGGLMDSDKGVFRTYIQKFFQSTIAVLIQLTLVKLGVALMLNTHIFWGVAALILAIKTPKFLQEFIIVSGGQGGISGTVYQSARLIQMVKGAMKR